VSQVSAGLSPVAGRNVDNFGGVVDNRETMWISGGVIHNLWLDSGDKSGDNCGILWIGTGAPGYGVWISGYRRWITAELSPAFPQLSTGYPPVGKSVSARWEAAIDWLFQKSTNPIKTTVTYFLS
jgi:hypothetical protein